MLISDKIDFKKNTVRRDKEGWYIIIKGSTQEENIVNMYAPNIEVPQYIKQILTGIKGQINSNMVEDVNTSFISMDRSFR